MYLLYVPVILPVVSLALCPFSGTVAGGLTGTEAIDAADDTPSLLLLPGTIVDVLSILLLCSPPTVLLEVPTSPLPVPSFAVTGMVGIGFAESPLLLGIFVANE